MKIKSNLWFENDQKGFFGKGRIELLEQIDRHGSISAAAKAMKMSYKAAWDAVNEMNNLSSEPIVVKETGGRGGGGTVLTEKGRRTIALYKELEQLQSKFWDALKEVGSDLSVLEQVAAHMTLRTSARNQLVGTVTGVEHSRLGSVVTLRLGGGESVEVAITRRSAEEMKIERGKKVLIILKSSWIRLCKKEERRFGNRLSCIVRAIERDSRRVEITVEIKGGNTLTVSMEAEEAESAGLDVADRCVACFSRADALLAI